MPRLIGILILSTLFSSLISQNIEITGITKIYYYKTSSDFFHNRKDSITGENLIHNYGKVSYFDKKKNKKIRFHLQKDSSIFAFKIDKEKNTPIYAISKGEKRYGVFMGGTEDLFVIFYSLGYLTTIHYDDQNYVTKFGGSMTDSNYYLVFVKKNFIAKNNRDINYFIQDKPELYKKYLAEKEDATTYYWYKNYVMIQTRYVREYNSL